MSFDQQQNTPAVMQVIPRLEAGGAERTTIEINAALIAAGWRSIVISHGGRYVKAIEKAGGHHITLPVDSKNPLAIWRHGTILANLVRKFQVNIIHARSRAPAWSALRAAKITNTPFVTTYHGAYKQGNYLKKWYNSSMVRGDHVIANSKFTQKRILGTYEATFPDLAEQMTIIPRGADLEQFQLTQVDEARVQAIMSNWIQQDFRRTGGKTASRPFIFMLPARLTGWKGHEVALEAVNILSRSGQQPHLRLIFCGGSGETEGDGPMQTRALNTTVRTLRAMVDEYGISDLVYFAGHCEDMPAAYAACDCVLVPSTRPEAFGRVAVEAGAMTTPVIATDHGGARETIVPEKTGILVPVSDASALACAMNRLMEMTPTDRLTMGESGMAHISEHFTTEAMCTKTLAVYSKLMQRTSIKKINGASQSHEVTA